MPGSKCLAGNQSGHDIILSKPFYPLFKIKKIDKNYLIHLLFVVLESLLVLIKNFDLILEMY